MKLTSSIKRQPFFWHKWVSLLFFFLFKKLLFKRWNTHPKKRQSGKKLPLNNPYRIIIRYSNLVSKGLTCIWITCMFPLLENCSMNFEKKFYSRTHPLCNIKGIIPSAIHSDSIVYMLTPKWNPLQKLFNCFSLLCYVTF